MSFIGNALNNVVPSLARQGIFGNGEYSKLTNDEDADIAVQLGSEIAIVKVKLVNSGKTIDVPVVVKVQFPDENTRILRDSATMFSNEVNMYQDVLPFLNVNNVPQYPKLYYGFATSGENPENDVIVLENVTYRGFSSSRSKLYLDYEHISLALQKLGELHAWSYSAKSKDKDGFNQISKKVKRLNNGKNPEFDLDRITFTAIKRGVTHHLEKGLEEEALKEFLKIMEPAWAIQNTLFDTEENFGVILHGDYCKNNIFFKYDPTGKPVDCIYFDLQLSKYGSPATDLSFFLYMHMTPELRDKHWDELLKVYWRSVRNNVSEGTVLPSYDEFLEHFACRAVYGFIHSSYFAPYMLSENGLSMDEINALSVDKRYEYFANIGGEAGTTLVADMVSHLLQKKYMQAFIRYYNEKGSH